ncbi:MAG: hypothetical protein PVI38_08750, partial [Desulfobacterales bacterium]
KASLTLPPQTGGVYHILIVEGRAKIRAGEKGKDFRAGETFTFTCRATASIHIENVAKSNLQLIQVELTKVSSD